MGAGCHVYEPLEGLTVCSARGWRRRQQLAAWNWKEDTRLGEACSGSQLRRAGRGGGGGRRMDLVGEETSVFSSKVSLVPQYRPRDGAGGLPLMGIEQYKGVAREASRALRQCVDVEGGTLRIETAVH